MADKCHHLQKQRKIALTRHIQVSLSTHIHQFCPYASEITTKQLDSYKLREQTV